ncbi:hypothetical protein [Streptosporangium sp. NPDC049376]|uniref:hypothetical protein n=1 Tax=Streptosporangium sp. NPDC049376 TaxID=3366192 RepID=UPI0037B1ED3B
MSTDHHQCLFLDREDVWRKPYFEWTQRIIDQEMTRPLSGDAVLVLVPPLGVDGQDAVGDGDPGGSARRT